MKIETLRAELEEAETHRAALEKRVKARQSKAFATLPARVGLKSFDDLVLHLAPYCTSELRARLNGAHPRHAPSPTTTPGSRGNRYPQLVKDAVKRELEAGNKTAAQISRELGPSVFMIKHWKRDWGMTRTYKKAKAKRRGKGK